MVKKKKKPLKVKRKVARKTTAKKKTGAKRKSGLTQMTCSLSEELAAVCGGKKMTRPEVMKKVWAYIKSKKLQDSKNRRLINPDAKLGEVIGKKSIDMLKLAGALSKHLS